MKILSCHIENFGMLSKCSCEFNGSLNGIFLKNGGGKSTLATFIKSMFFGLNETKKKDADENDRIKYSPWQGGRFGGNLTFCVGEKRYRVERFFGTKLTGGDDTFELYDLNTNKKSRDYSMKLGEELFGINAESFERTVFIPQKALNEGKSADISARLDNLINNTDDAHGYEKAAEKLKAEERRIATTGSRGLLYDADRKISRALKIAEQCAGAAEAAEKLRAEINAKKDGLAKLEEELKNIKNDIKYACGISGERSSDKGETEKKKYTFLIIFAALTIAGIIFCFVSPYAGAAAFVLAVAAGIRHFAGENRRRNGKRENVVQNPLDVGELMKREDQCGIKISGLKEEITGLIVRLRALEEEAAGLTEVQAEAEWTKKEYNELEYNLNIIKKTEELLFKAKESLSGNYLGKLKEGFVKYFAESKPTGGDFVIDADLNLSFEGGGKLRGREFLSAGERELANIAMRLSLTEALFTGEKPFIVMDDPFVNLDGEKLETMKKLLYELSKEYQIIYFTCHESRRT